MQSILELEKQGYFFQMRDGRIQFEHRGPGRPDAGTVSPWFSELKLRKAEAVEFLQAREEEQRRKQAKNTWTPPDKCYCCGGHEWWLSVHGVTVCATCHPPAAESLVLARNNTQGAAEGRAAQRAGGTNIHGKGTGGKVWQLSDAQASELEACLRADTHRQAVFADPGVVKRTCLRAPHRQNGSVWWPAGKWLEHTGLPTHSVQAGQMSGGDSRGRTSSIPGRQAETNQAGRDPHDQDNLVFD